MKSSHRRARNKCSSQSRGLLVVLWLHRQKKNCRKPQEGATKRTEKGEFNVIKKVFLRFSRSCRFPFFQAQVKLIHSFYFLLFLSFRCIVLSLNQDHFKPRRLCETLQRNSVLGRDGNRIDVKLQQTSFVAEEVHQTRSLVSILTLSFALVRSSDISRPSFNLIVFV